MIDKQTYPSDFYINHEVRIQLLEKTTKNISSILLWLLGTVIIGIAIPVTLHSFGWI
jgi:hypothetical protein